MAPPEDDLNGTVALLVFHYEPTVPVVPTVRCASGSAKRKAPDRDREADLEKDKPELEAGGVMYCISGKAIEQKGVEGIEGMSEEAALFLTPLLQNGPKDPHERKSVLTANFAFDFRTLGSAGSYAGYVREQAQSEADRLRGKPEAAVRVALCDKVLTALKEDGGGKIRHTLMQWIAPPNDVADVRVFHPQEVDADSEPVRVTVVVHVSGEAFESEDDAEREPKRCHVTAPEPRKPRPIP